MILRDAQFNEYCAHLRLSGLSPSDPEKKVIERAFRKLALKTHPDKVSHNAPSALFLLSCNVSSRQGGDAQEFRKVNEAYNRLIAHTLKLEQMEAEADLANNSVVVEISVQAVAGWIQKLSNVHGRARTHNVKNTFFEVRRTLCAVFFKLSCFTVVPVTGPGAPVEGPRRQDRVHDHLPVHRPRGQGAQDPLQV